MYQVGHRADDPRRVPGAVLRARRLRRPARQAVVFRRPPLDRSSRSRPDDGPREASGDQRSFRTKKTITSNEYVDGSGRVDPVRATRLFRQGATIIFTHLHQRIPSLGRLCEGLERAFSSRMQTNIYLTPPSAQGFAPHWDTHDVFILQIAGDQALDDLRHEDPAAAAEPAFRSHRRRRPDRSTMEFDLEAGDVCLHPARRDPCGAIVRRHVAPHHDRSHRVQLDRSAAAGGGRRRA